MADLAEDSGGRVLSIQSHVVQGYVGNKSAVFPLQLLGMDVDPINSVQFSNHTGYAKFTGRRLTGDELHELLDGMEMNSLLTDAHTHLLTGYIGSVSLLDAIVRVYERLRAAQSHPERLVYVCDPVMGDLGKLYVPLELVDLYRSKVLPICDVLTPNQYECELLAEMTLQTVQDAMQACKKLHTLGPKVVVVSSFVEATKEGQEPPKELVVIGSKVVGGGEGREPICEQYEVRFPLIDSYYTGTGDLFAALLLAWLYRYPEDFKRVLENVISTIQDVLKITLKLGGKDCDLKLIQSRHVIANPDVRFFATPLAVPVLSVLVDFDALLGTESERATAAWQSNVTNGKVLVDAPADVKFKNRSLIDEFVKIVGVKNVEIVTDYSVESTKAALGDMTFNVLSPAEFRAKTLPSDNRIESHNCETLLVSNAAPLLALASQGLLQVATPEQATTFIEEHNAACHLA